MRNIPEEIKGINRMRDYKICLEYVAGHTAEEIKTKRSLSISIRRINQILYDCSPFLNGRVAWPKSKRIHYLQKCISETPFSKKDNADLIEQVRKEIEGDRPLIDNSKHTHLTIVQQIRKVLENEPVEQSRINQYQQ